MWKRPRIDLLHACVCVRVTNVMNKVSVKCKRRRKKKQWEDRIEGALSQCVSVCVCAQHKNEIRGHMRRKYLLATEISVVVALRRRICVHFFFSSSFCINEKGLFVRQTTSAKRCFLRLPSLRTSFILNNWMLEPSCFLVLETSLF